MAVWFAVVLVGAEQMVVIATCCEIPVGVDGGDRRLIICYLQFGFAVFYDI